MTEAFSLFLSGFLSATLLPGSSEALFISLLLIDDSEYITLLAAVSSGNVLGSCLNWCLGRFLIEYKDHKWFPASQQQLDRAQHWFQKYGVWSLLFSWLPIVGDPLTLIAGFLRTRFWVFCCLVAIGKTIRYSVLLYVTLSLS
ncbi:VTT domain-containing protein [Sneathiella limimaris]|uniref:VTT domain-containing protein n=1 Tax=Sneathiella limimaris TaxID=1964213 RepID=UPI001469BE31